MNEAAAAADQVETVEGEVMSAQSTAIQAFTFGDPESVLDGRNLLSYIEAWNNGRWYEPPVSMDGLTRAFDVPGPHSSCIRLKVNLLSKLFVPSRWLDRTNFRKFALDYIATGNGYLERRDNLAGKPLTLRSSLSRYTRRGIEDGRYFFWQPWKADYEFRPGSVFHLMCEHPTQEIYGLPEFLGALQSALMGEAATLFRRKYYINGSHAGFIFHMTDETVSDGDVDAIRQALRDAKGPGNFRNLFVHAPKGKPDGIKIIPIAEVGAKDEFLNIKSVARDDVLAAHRVPPQLLGIIPQANGGFGDVAKASDVFHELEIAPLQTRFEELNDWLGLEAITFAPYEPMAGPPAPAAPANGR
ncbi:MAG: phage portal protein [Bacillota bacterium]